MAKKASKLARESRIAYEKWYQHFKYNIDQYYRMHDFVLGRQWTDDEEDMLKTFRKVPLQFNKLATLVNSILGEQQQNTPQLEVVPLSNCDEQTANIRQLLVKDIMLSTDARTVYQVAASQAFVGGFGAYIIDTEYTHSHSFDQDIVYRYFKDSTKCYWDMGAEEVSKIDGMHCGWLTLMTRPKFRQVYGKEVEEKIMVESGITATEEEIALATDPRLEKDPFSWADEQTITINHFYKRQFSKDMLYKMSNGKILNQEEMDELVEKSLSIQSQLMMEELEPQLPMEGEMIGAEQIEEGPVEIEEESVAIPTNPELIPLFDEGMPVRIEEKKEIKKSKIMHYVIAGDYLLEKSEFPADDLPLIFVDQNSYYDKNGKQICRPFVVDAIDAQRYLNYLKTQSAYILKVSRYDQFIGSKKNVQGLDTQQIWQDPYNVQGMLTYDESPSGAKPEQLRPPELSASLIQQSEAAIEDMYTSTGLYPSRLGQQGNEVSGAAIDARTRQGSYSTFVAFNSINRAISAGGKITNQAVPRVYDTERVIHLLTPDEGRKNITINRQVDEYGELIENDIRQGTFEVRLQAGPSYEGQKAQAIESFNMILQANPQLLNLIADLYAENLPLVNTIEIKNRLKTIVPPQIIEAGKTGKSPQEMGQNQPSPEEQAVLIQAQQKQAEIQLKQQDLEIKKQQIQLDYQIALAKLETERIEVAGELEEQKLRFLAESDRTKSENAIAHADNLIKLLTHKVA